MSYHIWTAEELEYNLINIDSDCWRFVEAQHVVSTMKIVDDEFEKDRLEELLEETKPPIPDRCKKLDYLLFTPFRYEPEPNGSRFRRKGQGEGAFYASEKIETALAEMAFYKLLFFAESPKTDLPSNTCEYTAFQVKYKSNRAIDLTIAPISDNKDLWEDPSSFEHCQNLADQARLANISVIRSNSIRCPKKGKNITILSCDAFAKNKPSEYETWRLTIKEDRIIAFKELPTRTLSFTIDDFNNDPRIRREH